MNDRLLGEHVLNHPIAWAAGVFAMLVLPTVAWAGGGPENVALVVNARSAGSQEIANHYADVREIHPLCIIPVPWEGSLERTDVATFRERILAPVLAEIRRRQIQDQIDYLVYSSDFPWSIDVSGDLGEIKPPAQLAPLASLTGATYLWQLVAAQAPVIGLKNNFYFQPTYATIDRWQSRGFRAWHGWRSDGQVLEAGGPTYLLSTMLGVTSGRGNRVEEVLDYLSRSAKADGTRPRGAIYYLKNGNVRSTTRDKTFDDAVQELEKLGLQAKVQTGVLPQGAKDVQGLMVGAADFDWPGSKSVIRPGAICEHLTSLGGVLRDGAGQTPLTEFLKHGAAGSSGTVTEPYAIQQKFPLASIHVHYARGCSLAEAFYQSVQGPYQLLIVGDPLCQPWAVIPRVEIEGIEDGQTISGRIELQPSATFPLNRDREADRFELFVDGRRTDRCVAGETMRLDTQPLDEGPHEIRIVAIDSSPIQTQGRKIVTVHIARADSP